jgi:RNA polymerase sigma factor (sigma-70 family)
LNDGPVLNLEACSEIATLKPSILQRVADGDHAAVGECLNQYGGLVWSMAKRFCADLSEAEDATQEIFVELWQCAARFDPSLASETTFISAIARRRLIDRLRRRRSISEDVISTEETIADFAEIPVDIVELAEDAQKAARCLRKLPLEKRKVIVFSVHHGLSHVQIAQRLCLPLGTVKTFARRSLLEMRDCMNRSAAVVAKGVTP